ncbi:MAG TPA: response regulator [Thermoanaerobaculia bacterium]|jgi:DNA-binding response OmpR family regulator|nr:response regulator [Thermoanaerobaculia bacterium]
MGSEIRVLVVDDEPAIRALVAKIVERAGLAVDVARDGSEAIAKLDANHYTVMVIDLMMPIIDGYAVVEHLRGRSGERPAIIVITAGDSAAIRRLDGSMVHSVIRKPFDIDVLGDLVVAAARTVAAEQQSGPLNIIEFPHRGGGKFS